MFVDPDRGHRHLIPSVGELACEMAHGLVGHREAEPTHADARTARDRPDGWAEGEDVVSRVPARACAQLEQPLRTLAHEHAACARVE